MKAILKSNRKIIVDVNPYPWWHNWFEALFYMDKNTEKIYASEELEFIEYYGG